MSKRKVLFVNPSLCHGGRERSLITMLKLLDKTKYDLTLFTYHDDMTLLPLVPQEVRVVTDENKPHYFRKPKAVFYSILKLVTQKLKMKNFSEKVAEKLRVYIHQQKVEHPAKDIFKNEIFDVVVANAEGYTYEVVAYIKAEKRYFFYRNSIDMHHETVERLLPQYNSIVAVSDGVKKMLCENYSYIKNKVTVIENYVDAQYILDKSIQSLDLKNKSILNLCTCGRLSREKGFDLSIEAACILKKIGLNFIWYFVGDGVERKKVEKLIEKYDLRDYVVITGFKDNPFPYIRMCDLYIQPSYHESFGRTIKEAVILGKAVVSTDTVGAHTVLEAGKYGEIVPTTAQSIADGIIVALKKDKQGVYKKYDINDNVKEKEKYIRELEKVLDR